MRVSRPLKKSTHVATHANEFNVGIFLCLFFKRLAKTAKRTSTAQKLSASPANNPDYCTKLRKFKGLAYRRARQYRAKITARTRFAKRAVNQQFANTFQPDDGKRPDTTCPFWALVFPWQLKPTLALVAPASAQP